MAFSLWEKVARRRRMRGLGLAALLGYGATTAGANPLIRPLGTFSLRRKAMEPRVRLNVEF